MKALTILSVFLMGSASESSVPSDARTLTKDDLAALPPPRLTAELEADLAALENEG
jgi:hypothetical protein